MPELTGIVLRTALIQCHNVTDYDAYFSAQESWIMQFILFCIGHDLGLKFRSSQ